MFLYLHITVVLGHLVALVFGIREVRYNRTFAACITFLFM